MLEKHAPPVFHSLRPPASEDQIRAAELAMDLVFPDDLRTAYLRHDGSECGTNGFSAHPFARSLFVWGCNWCSLEESVAKWQFWVDYFAEGFDQSFEQVAQHDRNSPDRVVRYARWDAKRIAVGLNGSPTATYIDLIPGSRGVSGQLIVSDHSDEPWWAAPSFDAYLVELLQLVEAGRIRHDQVRGWIGGPEGRDVFRVLPELQLSPYPSGGSFLSSHRG
jgi:internalin A